MKLTTHPRLKPRLTEDQEKAMRRAYYQEGRSTSSLAEEYKISLQTVYAKIGSTAKVWRGR